MTATGAGVLALSPSPGPTGVADREFVNSPSPASRAIDEQRVPAAGLDELLRYYSPGTEVAILVARRGRLRRVPVTLGEKPVARWRLEVVPGASRQQIEQRTRWLTGT